MQFKIGHSGLDYGRAAIGEDSEDAVEPSEADCKPSIGQDRPPGQVGAESPWGVVILGIIDLFGITDQFPVSYQVPRRMKFLLKPNIQTGYNKCHKYVPLSLRPARDYELVIWA